VRKGLRKKKKDVAIIKKEEDQIRQTTWPENAIRRGREKIGPNCIDENCGGKNMKERSERRETADL